MMNPEGMTKRELIKILLDDFLDTTPDATRLQHRDLWMRLNWLDIEDLQLLVDQVKKPGKPLNAT